MATIGNNILKAAELLQKGEVVAIPTETVYGLAANALNEKAVLKIFEVKQRPHYNPLIIHIGNKNQLELYTQNIPNIAYKLIDAFWPGPLTLLLPKKSIISDLVTAGFPDVAVRMPNHKVALELLSNLDFPLAAPSANPFGYISPTTSQHVQNQIGEKIEYILEGGACQKGVESTIVGFENNRVVLYRLGAITIEELENIAGKILLANKETNTPKTSGMLPYHYAPLTPFILCENILLEIGKHLGKKIGVISFSKIEKNENISEIVILSAENKLEEAAKNLYSALHLLDSKKLDVIIAQKFEEKGLGKTLNDRLIKASKR